MGNSVKVSIVTVCFNSEKTIRRCIESVINQKYDNIEYIIIDGGSTDSTVEIIKEYADSSGGIIKWISEPDDGIYDAMNKGIQMTSGELVGIINSDDWYETGAIENIINVYGEEQYQILYGMIKTIENDKVVAVSWRTHEHIKDGMIAHPACFISKKLYIDKGMYSLKYKYVADYEFMLNMCRDKEVAFKPVLKIIACFSTGGACSTGKAWLELINLQYKWGIISRKDYRLQMIKEHAYKLYCFIAKKTDSM